MSNVSFYRTSYDQDIFYGQLFKSHPRDASYMKAKLGPAAIMLDHIEETATENLFIRCSQSRHVTASEKQYAILIASIVLGMRIPWWFRLRLFAQQNKEYSIFILAVQKSMGINPDTVL